MHGYRPRSASSIARESLFSTCPFLDPELCKLTVRDARHERRGVPHLKVSGKGEKTRYVPLHCVAGDLIAEYLKMAGYGSDHAGALFRPLRNSRGGRGKAIYTGWGLQAGEEVVSSFRFRDRGARVARYGSDQCPGS